MQGRGFKGLVHKAQFERLLGTPVRSRSAHFALHHLPTGPLNAAEAGAGPEPTELSTGDQPFGTESVDNSVWLGTVVPKRHARRSVTRNLLRRQIRSAVEKHIVALPAGWWLIRLRMPFVTERFPAAASLALRRAAATELDQLLGQVRR